MPFDPQRYCIADRPHMPFIDRDELLACMHDAANPSLAQVEAVISVAMSGGRLSLAQTAVLLAARGRQCDEVIFRSARQLKEMVYGKRVVLFAPLYIGNKCANNCLYCGFRAANTDAVRVTLQQRETAAEVQALTAKGHKRLILVWGEHADYSPEHIAGTVRTVYEASGGLGRINRVNINAAPLDVEGFRTVKGSGIGTYQIFQETYDPHAYARFHPSGKKSDFNYRLTALDRALEAGIDDVGLGVLVGLGDWRYDTLGLVRHANHLEACYGIGPHTISFPRLKAASNALLEGTATVTEPDFKKMIAVLRLAIPYAGMILTAREDPALRDELLAYGVTQIDAGSNVELGGYTAGRPSQDIDREQFYLSDTRTLDQVVRSLVANGSVPSFCTACYRKGRTGRHFMELSTTGKIKEFCTVNSLLSFAEYVLDNMPETGRSDALSLIRDNIGQLTPATLRITVNRMLERIVAGERDVFL